MNKQELKKLMKGKLIAVIRGNDLEEAKLICKTLVESGITTLEITFSLPDAEKLIKELKEDGTLEKLSKKYFGEDVFSYVDK